MLNDYLLTYSFIEPQHSLEQFGIQCWCFYAVFAFSDRYIRYSYGTVQLRYSAVTVQYGPVTIRYSYGTVQLRYGTVRYSYGTLQLRYGTVMVMVRSKIVFYSQRKNTVQTAQVRPILFYRIYGLKFL